MLRRHCAPSLWALDIMGEALYKIMYRRQEDYVRRRTAPAIEPRLPPRQGH